MCSDPNLVYAAAARLERTLAGVSRLDADLKSPLPIAEAETHLDDLTDLLALVKSKLGRALSVMEDACERMEREAA